MPSTFGEGQLQVFVHVFDRELRTEIAAEVFRFLEVSEPRLGDVVIERSEPRGGIDAGAAREFD